MGVAMRGAALARGRRLGVAALGPEARAPRPCPGLCAPPGGRARHNCGSCCTQTCDLVAVRDRSKAQPEPAPREATTRSPEGAPGLSCPLFLLPDLVAPAVDRVAATVKGHDEAPAFQFDLVFCHL